MVSDHRLEGTDLSRDSLDGVLMCSTFADNGEGVIKDYVLITSSVVYRRKKVPTSRAHNLLCSTSAANRNGTHLVRRVVDRSSGLSEVFIRSGSYIGVFIASMVYPSPFMDK